MKKILLLTAIAVASGLSAAHADAPYVSIQGGIGGMHSEKATQAAVTSLNTSIGAPNAYTNVSDKYRNSLAYRLSAGYLFGDQFSYGLEVGYANYGDNTDTFSGAGRPNIETKIKGSYIDLLAVGKYNFGGSPSGDGAYVVGKAGLARLNQKLVAANSGVTAEVFNENKWKPEIAVGAGYNFNKNMAVDVSFHHVFADGNTNYYAGTDTANKKLANVNLLMVGFTYNIS